jgi:phospholipid-translocating ATPase
MSMLKELIDDIKRYKRDKELNKYIYKKKLIDGNLIEIQSCDLIVGDIIEVNANERIPADMILIYTR